MLACIFTLNSNCVKCTVLYCVFTVHLTSKSKSHSKKEKLRPTNGNREYLKWSDTEKEAVNRQFSTFINKMQCPRQLDCLNAQAKEPALANRTWKNLKFYVNTQINKYKSKR